MIKNPYFPKDNVTAEQRPAVKGMGGMPEITKEVKEIIEKYLKREVDEQKEPSWSVDYWKKDL